MCALFAVALAGGCASNDAAPQQAMQHPILEDVPLPRGFRLVDERSVGVSSGTLRVGKYEFAGDTPRTAAARFFKEFMPGAGFTLRSEDFDRGVHDLRFESAEEECRIRLWVEGLQTRVNISIHPLGRSGAAPPRPPPGPPARRAP